MRSAGSSGPSAAADHKFAADGRLDGLGRSCDALGAGGHVCERNAARNGREGDQGPRQHPPREPCAREDPLRTVADGAKDSEPWRRIVVPTCSRLSLECDEAPFTATVKQPAQQRAPRQTWPEDSTSEHAPLLRDYLAPAPAMPPRCASAQLSAESRSSSTGSAGAFSAPRDRPAWLGLREGPFSTVHTPP